MLYQTLNLGDFLPFISANRPSVAVVSIVRPSRKFITPSDRFVCNAFAAMRRTVLNVSVNSTRCDGSGMLYQNLSTRAIFCLSLQQVDCRSFVDIVRPSQVCHTERSPRCSAWRGSIYGGRCSKCPLIQFVVMGLLHNLLVVDLL